MDPSLIIYAIGDVHGCLEPLQRLEVLIAADATRSPDRPKTVLVLGDFVDRGPDTAGVIGHLAGRPPGDFSLRVLSGNHERMMLAFLAAPAANSDWLEEGGAESLRSYGISIPRGRLSRGDLDRVGLAARTVVPEAHVQFLSGLAGAIAWEGHVFVHAGFRPGTSLEAQTDEELLGLRQTPFQPADGSGPIVVHGHKVVREPVANAEEIAIDIGCYATGRLAAVRLEKDRPVSFLTV